MDKEFKCEYCNIKFTRNDNRIRHIKNICKSKNNPRNIILKETNNNHNNDDNDILKIKNQINELTEQINNLNLKIEKPTQIINNNNFINNNHIHIYSDIIETMTSVLGSKEKAIQYFLVEFPITKDLCKIAIADIETKNDKCQLKVVDKNIIQIIDKNSENTNIINDVNGKDLSYILANGAKIAYVKSYYSLYNQLSESDNNYDFINKGHNVLPTIETRDKIYNDITKYKLNKNERKIIVDKLKNI